MSERLWVALPMLVAVSAACLAQPSFDGASDRQVLHEDDCVEATQHSDFAWIQVNVFGQGCVSGRCHNGGSDLEHVDLTDDRAHGSLVQQASEYSPMWLVVPGSPSTSYLMIVLGRYDASRLATRPMPLAYDLCPEKIDAVERWIAAGASDD